MANLLYGRQQLEEARTRILYMAASVESMIRDVVSALHNRDAVKAMEIIDRDEAIDEMDNQLDEICLRILALENPVAADLRMVVAIMRATSNLERIADEASNIANHVVELAAATQSGPHPFVQNLAEYSIKMYQAAVEAFRAQNPQMAHEVCGMMDEADTLHAKALHSCFAEQRSPTLGMLRILIAHSLSRICERAVNIAEFTVFACEGAVIKHIKLKKS